MQTRDETRAKQTDPRPAELDRRDFLKSAAFVGGCSALAASVPWATSLARRASAAEVEPILAYELAKPENVLYSTCLQCHVACQIKAKLWNGTLTKLAGSPYSPQNYLPHLPYETAPTEAVKADGKLCAKGQAGVQTHYDPYRIRRVLKRRGPRGSGT